MHTHTAQYLSCSDYLKECSQLVDYNWQGNGHVLLLSVTWTVVKFWWKLQVI